MPPDYRQLKRQKIAHQWAIRRANEAITEAERHNASPQITAKIERARAEIAEHQAEIERITAQMKGKHHASFSTRSS